MTQNTLFGTSFLWSSNINQSPQDQCDFMWLHRGQRCFAVSAIVEQKGFSKVLCAKQDFFANK